MAGLGIEQLNIVDSLNERATTCSVTLAPLERIGAPAAEFRFVGDTRQPSGITLRPNGSVLDVYGPGDALHSIFHGSIEVMDDLENADAYTYHIGLSAIPASQAHRVKMSLLYDLINNASQVSPNTTNWTVLQDACNKVGIPFGRCDLPEVAVYGNYEIDFQNICEIAEAFCEPFNHFEYKHYFVRVSERDGLTIIGIDYTQAGGVDNYYELQNIENKTRTFQRYMPDGKIGNCDVLLVGADMFRSNTDNGLITNITQVWTTGAPGNNTDSWVESSTTIEYIIQILNTELGPITSIAAAQVALQQQGVYQSGIRILSSRPTYNSQTTFTAENVLLDKTETWYTYQDVQIAAQIDKLAEIPKSYLIYEETLTTKYPAGREFAQTLVKKWYTYGITGAQTGSQTNTYYNDGRGAWVLHNTQGSAPAGADVTNANIQFSTQPGDNPSALGIIPILVPDHEPQPSTVIGKYQLLDGSPLDINIVAPSKLTIINGVTTNWDPTGAILDAEQQEKKAFRLSAPYMGYDGLFLIWAMCQRQLALEQLGVYWEIVKSTATLDLSPAAGESIVISGSSGVCEAVEHNISQDAGVTTITMKRLITPEV
jgi:hypothetical protein